jgi:dihydrodipicolinate synthase/N-acetylneuraminate lyase
MGLTDLDHRPLIVAAVTPLTDGGASLDLDAIAPYAAFLESHGADGIFACGTTGEGVLLSQEERRQAAVAFRAAVHGELIIHCGALSTAETVALARHAAEVGADAVAVIPPPYFVLDTDALVAHMVAAARACAPLPFWGYAFTARSGYPLSPAAIARMREGADNVAGLKVSESPWERLEPYLDLGLPVLVGNEPMIPRAMAHGALGSVSGMAACLPEVVRAALDGPDEAAGQVLRDVRSMLEASGQFIAAAKHLLGLRGVPLKPDMRAPLRRLSGEESRALNEASRTFLEPATTAR